MSRTSSANMTSFATVLCHAVLIVMMSLLVCPLRYWSVSSDVIANMTSVRDVIGLHSIDSNNSLDYNAATSPHRIRHPRHYNVSGNVTSAIKRPSVRNAEPINQFKRYIVAHPRTGARKLKMARSDRTVKISFDTTCDSCVVFVESVVRYAPELLGLQPNYTSELWLRELESYYFEKAKSYLCMDANKTIYGLPVQQRLMRYTMNITQRAECSWHAVHDSPNTDDLAIYNYQHPVEHKACRQQERLSPRGSSANKFCTKYALDVLKNVNRLKVRRVKKIGLENRKIAKWKQMQLSDSPAHSRLDEVDALSLQTVSNTSKSSVDTGKLTKNKVANHGLRERTSTPVLRTNKQAGSRTGSKSPPSLSSTRSKEQPPISQITNISSGRLATDSLRIWTVNKTNEEDANIK